MRTIEDVVVSDLQSFFEEMVPPLAFHRSPIFRGQASDEWSVYPTLLREELSRSEFQSWCELEAALLLNWKGCSRGLLTREPGSELDWIALAQESGVPTRFSTWTETGLVALYYATEHDGPWGERDGVVWRLLPGKAELTISHDYEQVPERLRIYRPPRTNPAAMNQRTCYLSHPLPAEDAAPESLEDLYELGDDRLHLARIRIPASCKVELRDELARAGVDSYFISPDLKGLGARVRQEIRLHTESYEWVFPE